MPKIAVETLSVPLRTHLVASGHFPQHVSLGRPHLLTACWMTDEKAPEIPPSVACRSEYQ
jgi:hypothetical protein